MVSTYSSNLLFIHATINNRLNLFAHTVYVYFCTLALREAAKKKCRWLGIFTGLLQFPKNSPILVEKLGIEKKCQNTFPAIL